MPCCNETFKGRLAYNVTVINCLYYITKIVEYRAGLELRCNLVCVVMYSLVTFSHYVWEYS